MKTFNVVLVDDEDQVRGRIKSFIEYRDDFHVVGSANNGYDAIELIEKHQPDVVITDIRMPFIDGLELTKIIRRDFGNIKVAYISGYDDFMYAKEAIDLDVFTYLMKPVSKEDLNTFLDDLYKTLIEEYEAIFNAEKLNTMYKESLPLLIENQFNRLLHMKSVDSSSIEAFKTYNINLLHGEFVLALIEMSDQLSLPDSEAYRVFLLNMIPTVLKRYNHFHLFNYEGYIVLIINHDTLNKRDIENDLNAMLTKAQTYQEIPTWIGVSIEFSDFTTVQTHLNEAFHALGFNQYLNIGSLIFYDDIKTKKTSVFTGDKTILTQFETTIKYGTEAEIDALFDKIYNLLEAETSSPINLRYFMINIMSALIKFADTISIDLENLTTTLHIESFFEYKDIKAFFTDIKQAILDIRKQSEQATKEKSNELILKIINYIDTHYQDSTMQMETISDKFAISISYLSVLIKRQTGKTFNKYLTAKRINHAKELLKYSNNKVTEIAQIIGYHDVYHFSHTFKKYTGLSPKEYRDEG